MLIFPTAVLAMEGSWGLGYAELLPLGFAGYLLFGIGALPAGWLADRWSSAWLMTLFFLGSGLACIATGLATGPWSLALGLTLIGLFASIYHPVAIAWLVGASDRPGRALGFNGVFGVIGTGGAALIAGALADLIGWRAAFLVPGAICVALGVPFALGALRGGHAHGAAELPAEPGAARCRRSPARPVPDAGRDPVRRADLPDGLGRHAEDLPGPARRHDRDQRARGRNPGLDRVRRRRARSARRRVPRRPLRRAAALSAQLRAAMRPAPARRR